MENVMKDIAEVQKNYQKIFDEERVTKKAICDLVIPFRDKYKLTDLQALQIARDELSISEINELLKI